MLTAEGPKEEEKAVETPAAAQPVAAAPTMQFGPPQTYQAPPAFQNNVMQ